MSITYLNLDKNIFQFQKYTFLVRFVESSFGPKLFQRNKKKSFGSFCTKTLATIRRLKQTFSNRSYDFSKIPKSSKIISASTEKVN